MALTLILSGLALVLLAGPMLADPPPSNATTIFNTIDDSAQTGRASSIQLNGSGHPVISYADFVSQDLMLAVCDDPTCNSATITPVDTDFPSAQDTSLQLNSSGFPVIAYVSEDNGLRLVTCEDAFCTSTPTPRIIDNPAVVDFEVSLALKSNDFPVISYYDSVAASLRLAVCEDTTCLTSPISTLDSGNSAGRYNSLALNASDEPVISYVTGEGALKVAICGDAACSSSTLQSLGPTLFDGTSVAIGPLGRTFVAHRGSPSGTLDLVVCNNAPCTNLGFTTVDSATNTGRSPSLVLDRKGTPVISYHSTQKFEEGLRVAFCNDIGCFDPTLTRFVGGGGSSNPLALDDRDNPVVSYRGGSGLELAVCRNCQVPSRETLDGPNSVGTFSSLALNSRGFPVVSYYDADAGDLMLAVCEDRECASSSVTTVDDSLSSTGKFSSIALNGSGHPAISYWDETDSALELALCQDTSCSLPPTFKTVDDTSDSIGKFSSIVLNGSGRPVISYWDETNTALKVAVCNDATCSKPTRNTVDGSVRMVGSHTSLVLNASGFPVISYHDQTDSNVRVAVCDDAVCSSSTSFDVGFDIEFDVDLRTSLALNSQGLPVVSYHDEGNGELRMTVCNNANCSSREVILIDELGAVGRFSSLSLTVDDYPVISYFDATEQDLKVAVCYNTTCENPTLTTVAGLGEVGEYSSMQLDRFGFPVISYFASAPDEDLRVAVMGSPVLFRDGFESGTVLGWSSASP